MIISSLYYPNIVGGAEKSVQIIAENLNKFGITPVVVTISDEEKKDYVNGVKVYYVHHSSVYWSYYSKTKKAVLKFFWHFSSLYNLIILRKISNIIEEEKPDVAHTNNLSEFSVGLWKVFKKRNIPVVHTLRDYSLLCPRSTLFKNGENCKKIKFVCRLIMSFRRLFSKYVDMVIGNSDFILNEHIKYGFFTNSKKCVIFNSLDPESIIKKKKIAVDSLKFGFIGVLSYHKGIELLLKIFKEIGTEKLYVFGRGITSDYESHLKNEYMSDKIKFKGFIKTDKAFNMIDVLIVPSIWNDPLPRVIYEAYSYGIPVIGSDRGGIPEIIDKGKTGFIFDPDSEEQLKEKIYVFKNDPHLMENMSLYCMKKAKCFLADKVVKKYADSYRKVI